MRTDRPMTNVAALLNGRAIRLTGRRDPEIVVPGLDVGERPPGDPKREPAIRVAGAAEDRSAAVLPGELQLPAAARAALAEVAPVLRTSPGCGAVPVVQPVGGADADDRHHAGQDRSGDHEAHGVTLPPPSDLLISTGFVTSSSTLCAHALSGCRLASLTASS